MTIGGSGYKIWALWSNSRGWGGGGGGKIDFYMQLLQQALTTWTANITSTNRLQS